MKNTHEKEKNPKNNIYLLAFIDIIDRLDILMLEIRHLQQTIIHGLKAPTLYLPLRFEEAHLFGDKWDTKLSESASMGEDFDLVKQWIIRYPIPKKAVTFYYLNNQQQPEEASTKRAKKIETRLKYQVGKIWMGDNWVRDQRRQYHALCALQILKQRVLRDKIALARVALQTNLVNNTVNTRRAILQKPAFLILREAVLRQIDTYILVLRNHKHQVGQSLDFGMPSDPHPSIERRREMGIFMDFIFNRTLDVQRDMMHLCTHFNYHTTKKDSKNQEANGLSIFHGWSQNTTVSTIQLYDKINAFYNHFGSEEDKKEEEHIGYVNTSFWTPDRPDLHPLIAYPVAKSVIHNHLGGLDEVNLSNSEDNFTELMINLKSIFIHAINSMPFMDFLKPQLEDILNKISADLLAATVKGVAYLYASFLSNIAKGLASQLYVGKEIKLEMVYSLEQGIACYNEAIVSYLRLNLTALWTQNVLHHVSPLDQKIITGVREVTDELLSFLNRYTPLNRQRVAPNWKGLLASLRDEIIKSAAIRSSKKWCINRAADDKQREKKQKHTKKHEITQESKRCFPRSSRSINIRLQNYLFRELLQLKQSSNKALSNQSEALDVAFKKAYGLHVKGHYIPDEKGRRLWHPECLFSHIYAIPYQSAFLRSVDMLKTHLSDKALFQQVHWDMELGRSLFAFALEFHARETESPEQRLSVCVNQVAYAHAKIKTTIPLQECLAVWLCSGEKDKDLHLLEEINEALLKKLCDNPKLIGAMHLVTAFERMPIIKVKEVRYLELIAGYKLRDLLDILLNKDNYAGNKQAHQLFTALVQFLSIRPRNDETAQTRPKKRLFYNRMLTALGDIDEDNKDRYECLSTKEIKMATCSKLQTQPKTDKHTLTEYSTPFDTGYLPDPITSMLIKRLSITNFYPVSDPANTTATFDRRSENENGISLAENLKCKQWKTNFNQTEKKEDDPCNRHKKGDTWVILGRFDAISMIKVKLPCKCYIQSFKPQAALPHEEKADLLAEQFAPHFSRREIARPVKLLPEPKESRLFAMINITLQRRSMRLDFLYRLIRALNEEYPADFQSNLEKAINDLKQHHIFVTGFLTDGWGDILFKFSKAINKQNKSQLTEEDISFIFAFQQAIYEDFMVDRTEITFTPECLDHTLGKTEIYRISIETRMMEDRWLEDGIDNYTNILGLLRKHLPDFLNDIEVTMLPGRNDFKFTFTLNENYKNTVINDVFLNTIQWLEGKKLPEKTKQDCQKKGEKYDAMCMLGHLETYIERRIVFDA